jgi:hypothetical protein
MRAKENFNKKLLVEGNDDKHVIWALCEHFKINETFDVIYCKGTSGKPTSTKQQYITTLQGRLILKFLNVE